MSNTDHMFMPGNDDVHNMLQDLANDSSQLHTIRRFTFAESGSPLINDGDNGRL